jgi:hypothetical protein
MKARGRPILGGVTGFLFGLFVALDLFTFGVVKSNSPILTILPVLGIFLGIALAMWAPFGSSKVTPAAAPAPGAPVGPPPGTNTF